MLKAFLIIMAIVTTQTACGTIDASQVLEAVQLGPDECGTAQLQGNLDVGGNPFASTTVVVDIDKQKVSYVDGSGAVRDCE